MKKAVMLLLVICFLITSAGAIFSKDVYVKGYYRKDGTYVRPHVRSSPDNNKWNNYGPSRQDSELMNPRGRDNDRDGVPNYLDCDDDNDGITDDVDINQYGN